MIGGRGDPGVMNRNGILGGSWAVGDSVKMEVDRNVGFWEERKGMVWEGGIKPGPAIFF